MRHKFYWSVLFTVTTGAVQAQLEPGRGLLTGSVNASFNQYKLGTGPFRPNRIQAATTVSYGVFVKNNVLLGAAISLAGNRANNVTD